MPDFKVTWEFTSSQGSGWNELYYTNEPTSLAAVQTTPSFIPTRLSISPPTVTLLRIRATQVDQQRVTSVRVVNQPGTRTSGLSGATPEVTGVAAQLNLAAPIGSRKIWMRGLADEDVQRDPISGRDQPSGFLLAAFNTYYNLLGTNRYGMRRVLGQTPGPLTNLKILSVDGSAGDGTSIVTLAAAPGYPIPGRVIIGGASQKDLPRLNGRWQLMATSVPNAIRIPYQTPQKLIVMGGNGHCRQEQFTPISVFVAASCSFLRFATRATRSTDFRSRGARRAVRIRTSL